MDIVNLQDCKRFLTKDGSSIREILSPENSGLKRQSLAEATLPPGGATAEHIHPAAEEIYFILKGNAEMRVAEKTANVRAGDAIVLPPGTRHQIVNTGDSDLIFLCICVPAYSHEDTVLIDPQ